MLGEGSTRSAWGFQRKSPLASWEESTSQYCGQGLWFWPRALGAISSGRRGLSQSAQVGSDCVAIVGEGREAVSVGERFFEAWIEERWRKAEVKG